ncbi:MFS transporter [Paenibacillus sacheonensis]|uniref:MFS transporter n=1 Tax=Paenibacillus sacheonensis TaxID=742054 RepID=A0A7X5BY82_9BACL|nr:MFS transporter [Paenibacillus sacheonensis]MBM7564874.1 MFS family permease [Paenibacillus sacheonensis]NBC69422.1 MFS transporter [Paenibacillus sacheonensis]
MNRSAKISLLSLAITTTFGTMMAAPAVKPLAVAFPDTSALLVSWVVTLSSLFILPTLFIAGRLGRRFPRKNILLAGLLLYTFGGVGPAFMHSFTMILACRAILGLSIGLISPTFNTLIAESFQGEARLRMNGLQTSINGIGGAIFLCIGGIIASMGWREVFLTYFYAIGLIVLTLLFLPKFPPVPREPGAGVTVRLPKFFYAVAIAGGIHAMLFSLIPANLSLFLAGNGIGNVASTGYLTAFALIGVCIGGLAISRLIGAFGKRLVPLDLIVMAGGFLLVSQAHAVWTVAAGVFLIGLAEGMLFPLSFMKTAEVVPRGGLPTGISLLLASVYACQFLSPLFVRGVEALLGTESARGVFLLAALGLTAAAIAFVPFVRNRRQPAERMVQL